MLTACVKRRSNMRLVYVQAPPPTPQSAPTSEGGVMIIQEPAPPQPATPAPKREEEEPPTAAPESKPEKKPRVARSESATAPEPQPPPPAPASDTPQLEPLSSVHQKATLQQQIGSLKSGVELRIGRLSHLDLSNEDRKALQDARMFLTQSDTATQLGDLQQSLNLAQKADLLVTAVEKKH